MEPIPSLRIIKYVLIDQFVLKQKQRKKQNKELQTMIEHELSTSFFQLSLSQTFEETTFTVFDLETTGFFPKLGDEIVSIGAIKMNGKEENFSEQFYEVVRPVGEIPDYIYDLTGLEKAQVEKGISFEEAFLKFLQFSKGTVLVAHPASFDVHFLQVMAKRWGLPSYTPLFIDSYFIAKFLQPRKNNKLDDLVSLFQVEKKERHHALNDAQMTAEVFKHFIRLLREKNVSNFEDYTKLIGKKKGKLVSK